MGIIGLCIEVVGVILFGVDIYMKWKNGKQKAKKKDSKED